MLLCDVRSTAVTDIYKELVTNGSKRRGNMRLETCTVSLRPAHLGGDVGDIWQPGHGHADIWRQEEEEDEREEAMRASGGQGGTKTGS